MNTVQLSTKYNGYVKNIQTVGGFMLDRNAFLSAIECDNKDIINNAEKYIKPGMFDHEQLCWLLYYSARRGYLTILQLLINQRLIGINTSLFDKTSCLIEAVDAGQIIIVKFLLAMGAEFPNANGQHPIDIAIANNNEEMTATLFQQIPESLRIAFNTSYPLNTMWSKKRTIFERIYKEIIASGDLKTFANLPLLNLHGFNYEFVMSDNKNAVDVAIEKGQLDILKYLGDENRCTFNETTCLLAAIKYGHLHILKYFVENKLFSLNIKTTESWGPVEVAIKYGYLDIIKYLVQEKKLTIRQNGPYSRDKPEVIAIQYGHFDILKYLVHEIGCKLGDESIIKAIESNQLEILKYILKVKGTTLNVKNTFLIRLAAQRSLEVLKYLAEEMNFNLNVKNQHGYGTIDAAVSGGELPIVRYLIEEKHLPVNNRLIFEAIRSEHLNILKYLVEERKLPLNVNNRNGNSPVLVAAECSQPNILKYLVDQRGLTLSVISHEGYGPVIHAVQHWGYDNLEWLIKVKKCPFDPDDLLVVLRELNPDSFQTIFFDMFDAFSSLDTLEDFLNLAVTAFEIPTKNTIKNKLAMKGLFEERLQVCEKINHTVYFQFLDVYFHIFPVEAFQLKTDTLLRLDRVEDVFALCDKFLDEKNLPLRDMARIIKAEQIYSNVGLLEEGNPLNHIKDKAYDSIKAAIQAYYLLSHSNTEAARALKDRLNVVLSPKNLARTDVTEYTWIKEARKYYLSYVLYKQNPNNEHLQKLNTDQIQEENALGSYYGGFFRPDEKPESEMNEATKTAVRTQYSLFNG